MYQVDHVLNIMSDSPGYDMIERVAVPPTSCDVIASSSQQVTRFN